MYLHCLLYDAIVISTKGGYMNIFKRLLQVITGGVTPKAIPADLQSRKFTLILPDGKLAIEAVMEQYSNGGTAVQILTDDDIDPFYATLSIWVPETLNLPAGAFYVKHWSENENMVAAMLKQKILVEFNAPYASSGFIERIRAYHFA